MRRSGLAATLLAVLMSLALAGQVLGVTWSPAIKVSDDTGDWMSMDRALATASGATHLVWEEAGDGIHYRRSTNLGGTWGAEKHLASDSATTAAINAAVAAYGDTVAVAYRTRNTSTNANALYVRRSLDRGVTWLPRTLLASYTSVQLMGVPSIAVSSSGIHVAWTDRRDGKVYYRRSADDGVTFKARVRIATSTWERGAGNFEGYPSVAAYGARVYVAWSPAGSTVPECDWAASSLVMRRSTDGGATFKPVQTVDSRAQSGLPALAAGGATFIATYVLCGEDRVVVARSTDGGGAFARRTLVTSTATTSYWFGDVSISGSSARLVYIARGATSDRVVLRASADGGATWAAPATAASGVGIGSPQVVGAGTAVLVSYQTSTDPGVSSTGIFTRKGAL